MEKLELERIEVLFLPCQYFISSHATRVDDGSISLFLSFFLSLFLSFFFFCLGRDGMGSVCCLWWGVSSQQSQALSSSCCSAQLKWEGRRRERGGFPIWLPSLVSCRLVRSTRTVKSCSRSLLGPCLVTDAKRIFYA